MSPQPGSLNDSVGVTDPKTGKATPLFARYWADLLALVKRGPSQLDATYTAGAPAATGYIEIAVQGVTYKIPVST